MLSGASGEATRLLAHVHQHNTRVASPMRPSASLHETAPL